MTLLESRDISWKADFDPQFPQYSLLPGGTAALMRLCRWIWDLSRQKHRIFQEKSLRVELGGSWGPQGMVDSPPLPPQVSKGSIVLPREGKTVGFKDMTDKGLEIHSLLFFKEKS